jgi:hypothetical protein
MRIRMRIDFSSGEKLAPPMEVVLMNASIEYF